MSNNLKNIVKINKRLNAAHKQRTGRSQGASGSFIPIISFARLGKRRLPDSRPLRKKVFLEPVDKFALGRFFALVVLGESGFRSEYGRIFARKTGEAQRNQGGKAAQMEFVYRL